ncbi:FitA-like ribbon-helix-helix domain-containing protein [Nocardia sienata]|uniref:FitA-like ribbon-helix-helix domain-containing protein n=1 Tax=Nocardia sienata TaxID=248552 RepID=UPI0007A4BF71|nr:Arc family DNA-binding protein [Nocardia sienata]
MARLTVRDLPDDVREALRVRAAQHGRSTEAEVRAILIETVSPRPEVGLGTLLNDIGREIELADDEIDALTVRDRRPADPLEFG